MGIILGTAVTAVELKLALSVFQASGQASTLTLQLVRRHLVRDYRFANMEQETSNRKIYIFLIIHILTETAMTCQVVAHKSKSSLKSWIASPSQVFYHCLSSKSQVLNLAIRVQHLCSHLPSPPFHSPTVPPPPIPTPLPSHLPYPPLGEVLRCVTVLR